MASDPGLADAVLAEIGSYQHAIGTCRMGSEDDSMAVVDPTGKVQGLEALYVVDASIMPTIPTANTNLATLMIAERCAVLLRGVSQRGVEEPSH